ncbi:MAG: YceI family protein [Thalassolituus sp.]
MNRVFATAATFLTATGLSLSASADWVLSPDSSVRFTSTKNTDKTEVHEFTTIDGAVTPAGEAEITIGLASVETGIPIRNERMTSMLFNTDRYTTATISSKLPETLMTSVKNGETLISTIPLTVSLHGKQQTLEAEILATQAADGHVLVISRAPILVKAESFGLSAGIESLREIAGLERISHTVPVNFTLLFTESE